MREGQRDAEGRCKRNCPRRIVEDGDGDQAGAKRPGPEIVERLARYRRKGPPEGGAIDTVLIGKEALVIPGGNRMWGYLFVYLELDAIAMRV